MLNPLISVNKMFVRLVDMFTFLFFGLEIVAFNVAIRLRCPLQHLSVFSLQQDLSAVTKYSTDTERFKLS